MKKALITVFTLLLAFLITKTAKDCWTSNKKNHQSQSLISQKMNRAAYYKTNADHWSLIARTFRGDDTKQTNWGSYEEARDSVMFYNNLYAITVWECDSLQKE